MEKVGVWLSQAYVLLANVLAWAYNGTNTSPSVFLLQFERQLWL